MTGELWPVYSPKQPIKYSSKTTFRAVTLFLWRSRRIFTYENGLTRDTKIPKQKQKSPSYVKASVKIPSIIYFVMTQCLRCAGCRLGCPTWQTGVSGSGAEHCESDCVSLKTGNTRIKAVIYVCSVDSAVPYNTILNYVMGYSLAVTTIPTGGIVSCNL